LDKLLEVLAAVGGVDAVAGLQDHLADLPFLLVWLPALYAVGTAATSVIALLLYRLLSDSLTLGRFRRMHRRGGDLTVSSRKGPALLDQWCDLLREAGRQKHPVGPETLVELLEARYAALFGWLAGLRSTATLVGLFFTFLGLSLTLTQLSEALQIAEGGIEETLKQVRAVLPGLGTAFASSILGVGLALTVGLIETALNASRVRVHGGVLALSARWIEPRLATPHGVDAIPKLMDAQREAFKGGLAKLAAKLTEHQTKSAQEVREVVESLAEAQQGLQELTATTADNAVALASYAVHLQDLPEKVEGALATTMEKLWEQHQAGMKGIADATVASAKVFESSLENAETRVSALLSQLGAVTEPYMANLEVAARGFTESAQQFDALVRSSANSLKVSSKHIQSLVDASDRFQAALLRIEHVTEEEATRRAQEAEKFQTVAEQVTPMAEAVSRASGATQKAVERLEAVLGGEQMERYLAQLPRLTELVQEERRARVALGASAEIFQRVAASLEGLDKHAERFGETSALVRASHNELARSVGDLARGHLLPVIGELVSSTVKQTATAHEDAWQERYALILQEHRQALREIRGSIDRLETSQSQVLNWLTQSAWQRLRGRSNQPDGPTP
jgi:hypothetical protein